MTPEQSVTPTAAVELWSRVSVLRTEACDLENSISTLRVTETTARETVAYLNRQTSEARELLAAVNSELKAKAGEMEAQAARQNELTLSIQQSEQRLAELAEDIARFAAAKLAITGAKS